MKAKLILCIGMLFLNAGQGYATSFTDNGDDTISDSDTGLMWVKTETSLRTWETALSTCEGLAHAGHTDWRLPNLNELQTLADYTKALDPTIDTTFFPGAQPASYLSSTTYATSPTSALVVRFYDANILTRLKSFNSYFRCAR